MRFGVLGPVEVWDGGRRLAVGGPQQRALLAALLLNANRVVSTDRLVAYLWGDQSPLTARGLVQGCVAGLRRALQTAGPETGQPLLTRAPGYLLRVAPGELDLDRFEELAGKASRASAAGSAADLERAAECFSEALSLWRGPALDGIDVDGCRAEVARLDERRLAVIEERTDLELRLGRHAGLVGELQVLVKAHPLRERLWAQLMLALHRAERQADALAAYRRLRETLVEQLGVEPGAPVQQLQRAILAGGDTLAGYLRARGIPVDRSEGMAPAPLAEWTAPAQLPAVPAGFVGRARQLKRLDELLTQTEVGIRVGVISGMAGVGKTTLAAHWAHRVRERFDHGQLYVNLRGYAPPPPMRPIEALAGFLQALGVPADQVPADLEQAAARYRSLLADRRVLVLLDNAYSIEQVRPLLPAGSGCLVVVTSREHLAGLVAIDGAVHMSLDVLDPDEADDLLAQILGEERARGDPPATGELARLCAYLPLALRVAAANLTLQPRLGIAAHVAELAAGDRLAALAIDRDEPTAVRSAFDQSYAALPVEARRLFRLLGLVPGPHVTAGATAALAGTGTGVAARLLDRLASAHLLDGPAPDTYTLHDLVRLYAADRAHQEDSGDERRAALGRLFDWYLATADAAARLLYPERLRLPGDPPTTPPAGFNDPAGALEWLEAERPNLRAAVEYAAGHGSHPAAYRLAHVLNGFYILRSYPVEWSAVATAGLAAAQADQNPHAEAVGELGLGGLCVRQGEYGRAAEHYASALALGERIGWMELLCQALNGFGWVHRRFHRLPEAAHCYRRAATVNRRLGWLAGEAASVGNLGIVYGELGQLRRAANCLHQALVLFRQMDTRSPGMEGHILGALGEVCHQLGRLDEAERYLTEALALASEVGDRNVRAVVQRVLAEVHRDAGRYPRALELAGVALVSVREIGDPGLEPGVLVALGTTCHQLGRYRQALAHLELAYQRAQEVEGSTHEAMALFGLADAQYRLGRIETASDAAHRAVDCARTGGYRVEEGNALVVLAAVDLAADRVGQAIAHADQAIALHQETGHRLGEARARRELGCALDRRGDSAAATASWRRAYALFTAVGSPEAGELRALLPDR
jgi:DNA-binding SARP family transcriptional activator